MYFYYLLSLLAALCWALASLISADISRKLGGIAFNRIRLIFVSIMLISFASFENSWSSINNDFLIPILLSGVIGIFLGDTFLFMALQRIGPRRNNILFALAAPFTIILNIIFLKQQMTFNDLLGCFIVFFGVVIAIAYGTSKNNQHRWENIEGSILIGIIFAILAALGQAIGIIIMKPILNAGADPIASAAIRTTISALMLSSTYFINYPILKDKSKISLPIIFKTILSGFLGMALGMSLLLIALQKGDAGIVVTLSSTSPIIILFLLWIFTKKIPTKGAWGGAFIAIVGTSIIFLN